MFASSLSSLKNITTGFKLPDATSVSESLAHSIQFLPSFGTTDVLHESGINPHAGFELFQRYQGLLVILHENQLTLAAKAEATDQRVKPALERCNAQYRTVNALYKELWTLPKVLEGLSHFQESLHAICQDIDKLEVLLSERNAEVESLEFERWKIDQQHKLEQYRQLKRAELGRLEREMQNKKRQLENELVKGEEREKRKVEEEEEKYRAACEAAFRHSMEEFKKYGPHKIPRTQVKESLEQISLGAISDSDLEQFLGSDDDESDEDGGPLVDGSENEEEQEPSERENKEHKKKKKNAKEDSNVNNGQESAPSVQAEQGPPVVKNPREGGSNQESGPSPDANTPAQD